MIGGRRIDPEIAKLQAQIDADILTDATGRVTHAALHLRKAINLVVDLETTPDVREAARGMDAAATILLRWLDTHTKKAVP